MDLPLSQFINSDSSSDDDVDDDDAGLRLRRRRRAKSPVFNVKKRRLDFDEEVESGATQSISIDSSPPLKTQSDFEEEKFNDNAEDDSFLSSTECVEERPKSFYSSGKKKKRSGGRFASQLQKAKRQRLSDLALSEHVENESKEEVRLNVVVATQSVVIGDRNCDLFLQSAKLKKRHWPKGGAVIIRQPFEMVEGVLSRNAVIGVSRVDVIDLVNQCEQRHNEKELKISSFKCDCPKN